MTTRNHNRRTGWETMLGNLNADAVIAEAELYAGDKQRLTVDYGQPHTEAACTLLQQRVDEVTYQPHFLRLGLGRKRRRFTVWPGATG